MDFTFSSVIVSFGVIDLTLHDLRIVVQLGSTVFYSENQTESLPLIAALLPATISFFGFPSQANFTEELTPQVVSLSLSPTYSSSAASDLAREPALALMRTSLPGNFLHPCAPITDSALANSLQSCSCRPYPSVAHMAPLCEIENDAPFQDTCAWKLSWQRHKSNLQYLQCEWLP